MSLKVPRCASNFWRCIDNKNCYVLENCFLFVTLLIISNHFIFLKSDISEINRAFPAFFWLFLSWHILLFPLLFPIIKFYWAISLLFYVCGAIHILFATLTFLRVHVSGIKYIHMVVQPSSSLIPIIFFIL